MALDNPASLFVGGWKEKVPFGSDYLPPQRKVLFQAAS